MSWMAPLGRLLRYRLAGAAAQLNGSARQRWIAVGMAALGVVVVGTVALLHSTGSPSIFALSAETESVEGVLAIDPALQGSHLVWQLDDATLCHAPRIATREDRGPALQSTCAQFSGTLDLRAALEFVAERVAQGPLRITLRLPDRGADPGADPGAEAQAVAQLPIQATRTAGPELDDLELALPLNILVHNAAALAASGRSPSLPIAASRLVVGREIDPAAKRAQPILRSGTVSIHAPLLFTERVFLARRIELATGQEVSIDFSTDMDAAERVYRGLLRVDERAGIQTVVEAKGSAVLIRSRLTKARREDVSILERILNDPFLGATSGVLGLLAAVFASPLLTQHPRRQEDRS